MNVILISNINAPVQDVSSGTPLDRSFDSSSTNSAEYDQYYSDSDVDYLFKLKEYEALVQLPDNSIDKKYSDLTLSKRIYQKLHTHYLNALGQYQVLEQKIKNNLPEDEWSATEAYIVQCYSDLHALVEDLSIQYQAHKTSVSKDKREYIITDQFTHPWPSQDCTLASCDLDENFKENIHIALGQLKHDWNVNLLPLDPFHCANKYEFARKIEEAQKVQWLGTNKAANYKGYKDGDTLDVTVSDITDNTSVMSENIEDEIAAIVELERNVPTTNTGLPALNDHNALTYEDAVRQQNSTKAYYF